MSSSSLEEMSTLLECGILWTSQKGDCVKVAELLASGVNCNIQDSEGFSPLHHAVKKGNVELVELLISAGANTGLRTIDSGFTPLHLLAIQDDVPHAAQIIKLFASSSDYNEIDFYHKTALHYLALKGRAELLALLIQLGAEVDTQDCNGWTALHWASYENRSAAVGVLLSANARTDLMEADSWTCLHWAAFKAFPEVVEQLLAAGAEYWLQDNEGFTALYTASLSCGDQKNKDDCIRVIDLLLKAGADVNHAGSIGWTPLHRAAGEDNLALTEMLLQAGAIPDVQNISGDTPLHIATAAGKVDIVKSLIRAEASLNIQDIEWKTPIQRAIETLTPAILKPYLGVGAASKVKVIDIENTVMETIADYCRSGLEKSDRSNETAEVLVLLFEAGVLSFDLTKRMLGFLKEKVEVMSLRSLARVCIHRYMHGHTTETYGMLGLPPLMQQYLAYECD